MVFIEDNSYPLEESGMISSAAAPTFGTNAVTLHMVTRDDRRILVSVSSGRYLATLSCREVGSSPWMALMMRSVSKLSKRRFPPLGWTPIRRCR